MTIKPGRKVFSWLFYAVFLIGVLVVIDYCFYLVYYRTIVTARRDILPFCTRNTRIGTNRLVEHASDFRNFPLRKKPGVIRIGCFGDSFTFGYEVGYDYDYPTLLGEILKKSGYTGVEVINFAMTHTGFSQLHCIWQDTARRYDLDYILIMPSTFWERRDTSFAHAFWDNYTDIGTFGEDYTYYLNYYHARYILKDRRLCLLEPVGTSQKERFDAYFRFIPHWRYLRYDINPPAFLNAPLHYFAPTRTMARNPFYYYHGTLDQEMRELYLALLRDIVTRSRARVILLNDCDMPSLYAADRPGYLLTGVKILDLACPRNFFYRCDKGHNGYLRNLAIARQISAYLIGQDRADGVVLYPNLTAVPPAQIAAGALLWASPYVSLQADGQELARLFRNCREYYYTPDRALVALGQSGSNFLVFFTLSDAAIRDGDEVKLCFEYKNGSLVMYELGELKKYHKDFNVYGLMVVNGDLTLKNSFDPSSGWAAGFDVVLRDPVFLQKYMTGHALKRVYLMIGKNPAAQGAVAGRGAQPVLRFLGNDTLLAPDSYGGVGADTSRITDGDPLMLHVCADNGRYIDIPIGRVSKKAYANVFKEKLVEGALPSLDSPAARRKK